MHMLFDRLVEGNKTACGRRIWKGKWHWFKDRGIKRCKQCERIAEAM